MLNKIATVVAVLVAAVLRFTLAPQGNGTKVTQAMYGPNPFLAKLVDLFFSMDKMVGQKYEEGLASLKAIAER